MKKNIYLLLLFVIPCIVNAQNGPIEAIKTGYGSNGSFAIDTVSFPSIIYKGKNVDVFFPKANDTVARPTIFFSHGFGGDNPAFYSGIITNLVSNGYVVVFSPYASSFFNPSIQYNSLFTGFEKAVDSFPNIIDSTKVAFMGHSFGAGASPTMAYRGMVQHAWGKSGAFLFPMAQFYTYELSQEQLKQIPSSLKAIIQVYDKDATCDHRMAIDIFENLETPDSEKDYVVLNSDTVEGYVYAADHGVSTIQRVNALDYYGMYKLMDALADYTFNDNATAKNIALGNGSAEQIYMGETSGGTKLKAMTVSDSPVPFRAGKSFTYSCNPTVAPNPRSIYCPDDFVPTSIQEFLIAQQFIFPNPAKESFTIQIKDANIQTIEIFNAIGQEVLRQDIRNINSNVQVNQLAKGIYTAVLSGTQQKYFQKLIIE